MCHASVCFGVTAPEPGSATQTPGKGAMSEESAPLLTAVAVRFYTHGDGKKDDTLVHVFVKNRLGTSLTPDEDTTFVSNLLAHKRYEGEGDLSDGDKNPYIARGLNLSNLPSSVGPLGEPIQLPGQTFDNQSSHEVHLTPQAGVTREEIVLPEVNIHIQPEGEDRWIFDYTITFTFADSTSFSFSSNVDGVTGIILDQDNKDYSGICRENPLRTAAAPSAAAATTSVLKRVTLELVTHAEDKNANTRLNVHIVNRLSAESSQDIAVGPDLFRGVGFTETGTSAPMAYSWFSGESAPGAGEGTLASNAIRLSDIVLPQVFIVIDATEDRWSFDYQVTFEFGDPRDFGEKLQVFSSRTSGIVLDQDVNKHSGVYRGRPFPTVAPPTAPQLTERPVDHVKARAKVIPLALLRDKLEELIADRDGTDDSDTPPLERIWLGNSGAFNPDVIPESYVDPRGIVPLNRHASAGGPRVAYAPNPTSLGQLSYGLYFADFSSSALGLSVDITQPLPFTLKIDFDTSASHEILGGKGLEASALHIGPMKFNVFSISILLTLDLARTVARSGAEETVVDIMSWAGEIEKIDKDPTGRTWQGTFLKKPVDVPSPITIGDAFTEQVIKVVLETDSKFDWGGALRKELRDKVFSKLTTPDAFTKETPRDQINSMVTSWLLGGVADDADNTDGNNAVIEEIGIQGEDIVISYTGARNVFVPQAPTDWPTAQDTNPAYDFSPGNLANIDHIVVLTMENRSFDHMLGYLSLPVDQGGMGRSDVDGLKGGESNPFDGKQCPSFPLTDTLFAPDPPHGHEPVAHAIDGGLMDGFAQSYGDAHGAALAAQIMGHQTALTVPSYDALARDFAIGQRWFASHPGPTFCNRFYELTGRLNLDSRGFWELDNSSPIRPVFTPTIFDHLSDEATEPVTWAYFEHGYCFLRFFERHTFDAVNIASADDPEVGFFTRARTGDLPNVSFIDPHFVEYPPNANCDGPPSDVKDGQDFVRKVVEAVIASPAWNKTMLVIVYDEHGGFYDHVPPPAAVKVSEDSPIETLGVRVPMFVVSPWVDAATVFGHDGPLSALGGTRHARGGDLHFDHTSILKTIVRRFMSKNPPYMGARYAAARDLSAVVGNKLREPQFLPFIRYNIQFVTSSMMLDVQNADAAPGTPLWQFGTNGTVAQDFSFEDAGDGYVYIRSNVSNLYLTVNEPRGTLAGTATAPASAAAPPSPTVGTHRAPTAAGNLAATADAKVARPAVAPVRTAGPAPGAGPAPLNVVQDVKYADRIRTLEVGGPDPARQMWRLSPIGASALDHDRFMISSQAFPEKMLQPTDPAKPESIAVLGEVGSTAGPHGVQNVWRVSSPLTAHEPARTQASAT
jgi:phospholipase C